MMTLAVWWVASYKFYIARYLFGSGFCWPAGLCLTGCSGQLWILSPHHPASFLGTFLPVGWGMSRVFEGPTNVIPNAFFTNPPPPPLMEVEAHPPFFLSALPAARESVQGFDFFLVFLPPPPGNFCRAFRPRAPLLSLFLSRELIRSPFSPARCPVFFFPRPLFACARVHGLMWTCLFFFCFDIIFPFFGDGCRRGLQCFFSWAFRRGFRKGR